MSALPILKRLHPVALGQTQTETAPLVKPVSGASRLAPPVRRLVVLIPNADTQEAELAREIWTMASRRELPVLLLGTCNDPAQEPKARRRLTTIAALARDRQVQVETRLQTDDDWSQALRRVHRHSDLVICHAEQQVAVWGVQRRPLSQWLAAQLKEPVAMLTGFYPFLPPDFVNPAWRFLAALIPILIFLAFTAIQIAIHQLTLGSLNTLLLLGSVVLEYGLIGLWNYFFN